MRSGSDRRCKVVSVLRAMAMLLVLLILLAIGGEWCLYAALFPQVPEAQPVELAVYYESLCPDSEDFLQDQLYPAYEKISNIFHLELVPYGNAHESFNSTSKLWNFRCQHRSQECLGNILQTCAIHILGGSAAAFPFIYCMVTSAKLPDACGKECAEKFHLNFEEINSCATNPIGNELEHQMALKTDSLNPPQDFIPWITINRLHTEKIQEEALSNLTGLLCSAYQGSKPDPCRNLKQSNIISQGSR